MRRLVVAVVVALGAIPAHADPSEPERLYIEGQRAYDGRRYDAAVVAWTRSYELSKLPALLFNLAQAYRLRALPGDCVKATDAYRQFAARDPKSPQRPAAESFIAELAPCVAAAVAAARPAPSPPPPAAPPAPAPAPPATPANPPAAGAARPPGPAPAPTAGAAAAPSPGPAPVTAPTTAAGPAPGPVIGPGQAPAPAAPAPAPPVAPPPAPAPVVATSTAAMAPSAMPVREGGSGGSGESSGSGLKVAAYVTGGAGLIVIATGVYFGRKAQRIGDEVTRTCKDGCDWSLVADRDAEGRSAERTQWILYGVGAAGLVTGGVLYFLGARDHAGRVAVVPRAGGAALTWTAAW